MAEIKDIRETYEQAKIKLTSLRMPTYKEVVDEARAYKDNIQDGVVDATDPCSIPTTATFFYFVFFFC